MYHEIKSTDQSNFISTLLATLSDVCGSPFRGGKGLSPLGLIKDCPLLTLKGTFPD